jgi:two-component system LytT family response regulator
MKIRTLIVEDEPLARERLRGLLEADADIEVVGECADGRAAVAQIESLRPELVFLDIQLPELDGFGVLATLAPGALPAVVFTTAYDRFAIKAFEVHALDYLLKPFDRERFEAALRRAKAQLARTLPLATEPALRKLIAELRVDPRLPERLSVRSSGRITLVSVDQIDWIEAADNYVILHAGSTEHLHRETMKALETRLPSEQFVRISRSCIVNVQRVKELQSTFHGSYTVVLVNGARLPASRRYRANVARLSGRHP